MPSTRVAFFEIPREEERYVKRSSIRKLDLLFFREELREDHLDKIADVPILSIFIYSKITADRLDRLPNLKLIATRSTGYDHIDLDACRQRGILVCNVPRYGENTVAEHTFALILALSRNLHRGYLRALRRDFSMSGLTGFDLKGKTLGVIGAGHIGLHVIRMAKGFSMEVLAFDVRQDDFLAEVLDFRYVGFEDLLSRSDIISLHAPYTPKTHHMINMETVKKIKPGAILINTARGALVDTDALVWALDNKILAGAGLDVLEGEELIKEERAVLSQNFPIEQMRTLLQNHILMNREDVVITPHIAFNSREALQRILDTTLQNIEAFRQGAPMNLIT